MTTPRFWASAFYLAYYAAAGALFPYLNLFFQQAGMDNRRIGVLAALPAVMLLFAAPLWGGLADALRLHQRLLPLAMLGTLAPALLLMRASSFPALAALVLLHAFCIAPVIPLADNAALALLGDDRHDYGALRVWGAVGFGLTAWGAGALVERWGMGLAFAIYACLMVVGALIAARLPAPRFAASEPYWVGLRRLSTDGRWLGFLAAVFMAGVCFAILNNFLVIYLTGLGAGEGLFGLSVAAAGLSELLVFALSPLALRKWGTRGLLVVAFAAFVVRALAYSFIHDPRWAVGAQLLHGLTFAALWTAGVTYSGEIAPPGLGATAQSVFGGTMFGLAGAVGALLGGGLYDWIGPAATFRAAAFAALVGLAVFAVAEARAAAPRYSTVSVTKTNTTTEKP